MEIMGNKKKITPIVIVAMIALALAAFSTPVSASGNPGSGCPSDTRFYDTINGSIYFEQKGWGLYNKMKQTFDVPPGNIKLARVYTGFWEGSPGKGGYFNITIQNATGGSYTTAKYKACDPCPNTTDCASYQSRRCDALNDSVNSPWNNGLNKVNMHDYIVGCGVQFISFNATPYITPGTNTITVRGEPCPDCTRGGWDGRIYVIALLVVYENSSMPEMTYWINEGGLYLEKGSECDGPQDHLDASKYFNGTHVSNPKRVKLWSLGWPHVINATEPPAYTKLNGHNIGYPDITESHAGGYNEVLLRWNNISTSYLNATSNLLEYHDPDPLFERSFAEVLIVQGPIGPDLEVTHIEFPTMMRPNKYYTITAKVANYGDVNAGAFNVSLEAGTYYKKVQVTGLNAGASTTVSFTNVNLPEGCYNFTVTADCDNNVSEGNEYNNERTEKYQVGNVIVVNSNSDFDALVSEGLATKVNDTYYIQNLDITNCAGSGIRVENTNVPFVITNCTIHDCLGRGIYFHNVTHGTVKDSEVRKSILKGIRMTNTSYVTIDNNYVHDNLKYGIDIYPTIMPYPDCEYITVSNNTLVRNLYGIELLGYNCTLRDNVILNTTAYGGGESGWGIYVAGNNSKIYNNTIKYSHSYGMYVDYDRPNLPTVGNCIFGNTFVDNLQGISHKSQAYDSGANYWNSLVELGYYNNTGAPFDKYIGNNWSDYKSRYPSAVEVDGSEIWNTAYNIDGGSNKDNYPLMKPWANYSRIRCGDANCDSSVGYADARDTFDEAYLSRYAANAKCDGSVGYADARAIFDEDLNCCIGCEVF